MKNYLLGLLALTFTLIVACGGNTEKSESDESNTSTTEQNATAEYDLSANGIPVIVTGPAGAEVKKGLGNAEMEGIKTINYVVDKDAFKLDVTYTDGTGYDKAELLKNSKEIDSEDEGFEIVSEEEFGYIFKTKTEDGEDYSFYYVMMKNDKPVEFSTGLYMSSYTLDQVKALYEAAKAAK